MRFKLSSGAVLLMVLAIAPLGTAFQWDRSAPSGTTEALSAALPHPTDPGKTLLASENQLFEAFAGSKSWKSITPARSGIQILRLYSFPETPEEVFVLADRALFRFYLKSPGSWHRIYESKHGEKFTSFAISPGRWFLGSNFHLYESSDLGRTWKISSALSEDPVCFLKFSERVLYAASDKTLYASSDSSFFKKTLSLPEVSEETPETPDLETSEEPAAFSCPFYDILSEPKTSRFWAATKHGVYESENGESWKALPKSGFSSLEIRHLVFSETAQTLFAADSKQIYRMNYEQARWQEIFRAGPHDEIKGLLSDEVEGKLYGVTTHGFVWHPLLTDGVQTPEVLIHSNKDLFRRLIRLEPSAREIYQAVVRDANTQNSKISRWQAESRLRALLPSVSFGKDFSRGNNIDIDRGSTTERDTFIEGPADLSNGWDLDVSWDLGDFIFNSSQTSIDSREKLMVELRHDLTQEATRLYYERRRLQMEAALTPAPGEQEHLLRLIQIEELTSLLDGMTNGYLAKKLELLYRKNPELQKVWEYVPSGTQPG